MKKLSIQILLLTISFIGLAQVPSGYYNGTDGLEGEALKSTLYNIIKGHTEFPYTSSTTDTWDILKETDKDPDNPDNVIGIYSGFSMDAAAEYADGDGWTREHVWAKSRGDFGTEPGPGTDVHHLRPEDNSTNTARSNRTFAECNEPYVDASGTYQGETGSFFSNSDFVWEPRAEVKGDIARMIFYMATRYEGENGEPDLEIVDYIVEQYSTLPEHGKLVDLLIWHEEDPVDDYERNRNDVIYSYQNNRNPFIDHPEFVARIWGDVSGPFVSVDKNEMNADFGAVAFGSSNTQLYSLNAYNLEADVTVVVEAPFYVSIDNSTFSNSLILSHADGQITESFDIYLKFEPQQVDGLVYNKSVVHSSTNMTNVNLDVTGKEGEATLITIAQARTKDLTNIVNVTGVVIGGENNSSSSRVLYDGTAGIVIRSPDGETNETGALVLGDSVLVSGALTEYSGLLQVNGSPMSVTLIAQDATLPAPKELTIAEVNESYESQLVIIKDVTFTEAGQLFLGGGSDGNFEITDGTGTLMFRIGNANHPLVGSAVPSSKCDVIGYIGQFINDYQITPRTATDIIVTGEVTQPVELITIAEARTKNVGDVVGVKGIVIGGENNNGFNRVVFDGTAGIVVRGMEAGNSSAMLEMGDSVQVSGGLLDYNGLLEIEQSPVRINVLNNGNSLPDPQEIRLENLGEEYESELVVIKEVSIDQDGVFAPGNYTLTDESGSAILRIGLSSNPLVGTIIPKTAFDLIGFVGQDNTDYQIFPRLETDLFNIVEEILGLRHATPKLDLIYPNPSNEIMHIRTNEASIDKVVLYDLDGKLVFEQFDSSKVHIAAIPRGLYIVLVQAGSNTYYSKVFIK